MAGSGIEHLQSRRTKDRVVVSDACSRKERLGHVLKSKVNRSGRVLSRNLGVKATEREHVRETVEEYDPGARGLPLLGLTNRPSIAAERHPLGPYEVVGARASTVSSNLATTL